MKKLLKKIALLASVALFAGCNDNSSPEKWSEKKLESWFQSKEWLNGWDKTPHISINKRLFAVSYHRFPERWNMAFSFLRDSALTTMKPGRYDLDGENLYVSVSDYNTKDADESRFESHEKYIDIQYVASGYEKIGITTASEIESILEAYDPAKDVRFLQVDKAKDFQANSDVFFIFFPEDIHKPGIKDRFKTEVRKIVVKVKVL